MYLTNIWLPSESKNRFETLIVPLKVSIGFSNRLDRLVTHPHQHHQTNVNQTNLTSTGLPNKWKVVLCKNSKIALATAGKNLCRQKCLRVHFKFSGQVVYLRFSKVQCGIFPNAFALKDPQSSVRHYKSEVKDTLETSIVVFRFHIVRHTLFRKQFHEMSLEHKLLRNTFLYITPVDVYEFDINLELK